MVLKKRTILIFPDFNNMKRINELREKYDPLSNKVCPHITLVFPFESSFTTEEISEIINIRLQKVKPFALTLKGLSISNYWLSLDVVDGMTILQDIHKILYDNEFLNYKPVWLHNYVPHITVGQFRTVEEAQKAYELEKDLAEVFNCIVDKISVEIIGDDDQSIIEIEQLLS